MISIILNESNEEAQFVAAWPDVPLQFYAAGSPCSAVHPDTTILSVFIHTAVRAEDLARLPKLRLIATRSTGYDHIDLDYCAAHGITVCNVPAYGERTVAEYAMALLLASSRMLIPSTVRLQRDFRADVVGLRGIDIFQKTIGIVGTGRIGRNFGRMCTGFAPTIVAYDVHPDHTWATEVNATYVGLDELYRQSDIISFHAPLTPQTHHIFGMAALSHVKHGVIIINTSRGALIANEALLAGLDSGQIRAAGLDVEEYEHLIGTVTRTPEAHLLKDILAHPHVIASAHNAFNSHEAIERIMTTTIDTIRQVQAGMAPQYVVMAR
jgi:D-lactate dehydrogenase